jgi:hypothetical protein
MIKKIIKFFIKGLIIVLTLFLIVLLVARKLYPPEKLKTLATSQIETAINRQVTIGDVWLNPFKGITAENIIVYERNDSSTCINDTTYFFKVDKLLLKYRFLSLFKKEISIAKVTVENPSVNLIQDQDFHWNFDDLITPTEVDSTPIDTATTEFVLPLTLDIRELVVKNITVNLEMNQQEVALSLKSGGITVNLKEVWFPRNSFEEIKAESRANVKIFSLEEPWKIGFESKSIPGQFEMSTRLQMDVNFRLSGLSNVNGTGEIALADVNMIHLKDRSSDPIQKKFPLPQLCALAFDFSANLNEELINLKQLSASIGNEKVISFSGKLDQILNQPLLALEVVESEVRLHKLSDSFLPILPDTIQSQFENLTFDGIASLAGTKISGYPLADSLSDGLHLDLNFTIQDLNIRYSDPVSELSHLDLDLKSSIIYDFYGIQNIDLKMVMLIDSIFAEVDTLNYLVEDLTAELSTSINENFVPDSLTAIIKIQDFFDVPLDFSLNFKPEDGFNSYNAKANLSCLELPLAELTNEAAEGELDFLINIHSQNLNKIEAKINIFTDIIEIADEIDPIIIYPLDIISNAVFSTDTSLKFFKLDHLKTEVSDFATLSMQGNFLLEPEQKLIASIDTCTIDFEKVLEIVPEQFLEGIENLTVFGRSELTSNIEIIIPDTGKAIIDIYGNASVAGKGELPEFYTSLGRLTGAINFQTDGITASADMEAGLDSLVMVGFQDEPLRNISVDVHTKMPDFETILVESSSVYIPDYLTNVLFSARIDSLSGQMQTTAASKILMDTNNDTITILNVMNLSGQIEQNTTFSLTGDMAHIEGDIRFQDLNVVYDELAQVDSISGFINFAQNFDIKKAILVESNNHQTVLADAGTFYYDLLRPYYKQRSQQFSHVHIVKIKALDYYVEDINVDLIVDNERIEIPRFSLNLYDGNMAGLINVNVHDGDPEKIEWKVKANVSRMNSSKLIPSNKIENKGADLNMNLELSGKGFDPTSDVEVGGYLYVTKIGPQFTDNVLKSLDPKRTDKSIQDTRKLLNWGYKPKLISFEIKHDNLYPSIHLVKGNFITKLIPLNISRGKIELARIPVKFFLSNLEMDAN